MVLLIKQDKSLVCSVQSRLYQKENAVNSLTIYCPCELDEVEDMSKLYAILYYTTAVNDAYVEMLEQEESDKEGYLMYKLPVDTKFTNAAGTNTVSMAFTADIEGEEVVLRTSELNIPIYRWDNAFKFVSSDGLAAIVRKIHELEEKQEEMEAETPNDLKLTEDLLQLTRKSAETGEDHLIGDGVEILVPGDPDDEDEDHDGVIDIDDLPDSNSSLTSSGFKFMEL